MLAIERAADAAAEIAGGDREAGDGEVADRERGAASGQSEAPRAFGMGFEGQPAEAAAPGRGSREVAIIAARHPEAAADRPASTEKLARPGASSDAEA